MLLEKSCYLTVLVYWFAVKRNRCWVMWLHLQLSLTWLLKFGWALFSIFRHTSVECCFRATPLLPRRAGRSCRAPARISVLLFPLLCMPQGAIMQNADGNPACWPNWDHPYLVLHAPHALLRAWCHELWHGHCYRLDTVGLHKVQPALIKFSAPQCCWDTLLVLLLPLFYCVSSWEGGGFGSHRKTQGDGGVY